MLNADPDLSHKDAKRLFFGFADDALEHAEALRLKAHLEDCDGCRDGWERYARSVNRVRSVQREKAPPALATVIVHRARRRRLSVRALQLAHAQYRVPVEAIIPLLLGVAVAALLVLLAP